MLLDTHVLVWLLEGSSRLGPRARARIDAAGTELAVTAIAFWEIAMLHAKGRLELRNGSPQAFRQQVLRLGVEEVALDGAIGIQAAQLAHLHSDPADRMVVATALSRAVPLMTADERLLGWKSSLVRVDARA